MKYKKFMIALAKGIGLFLLMIFFIALCVIVSDLIGESLNVIIACLIIVGFFTLIYYEFGD